MIGRDLQYQDFNDKDLWLSRFAQVAELLYAAECPGSLNFCLWHAWHVCLIICRVHNECYHSESRPAKRLLSVCNASPVWPVMLVRFECVAIVNFVSNYIYLRSVVDSVALSLEIPPSQQSD